jgi:hypothetical protein
MSDLSRRPGSGTSRATRERRAFQLVVMGGVSSVLFVVTLLLAIFTSMSGAVPFVWLVVAVACGLLFRRTVGS